MRPSPMHQPCEPTTPNLSPYSAEELEFNFALASRFVKKDGEEWADMADMLTHPVGDC